MTEASGLPGPVEDRGRRAGPHTAIVALAGGGTAGHVNIGIAIAEALRRSTRPIEPIFLGRARELEHRLVELRGLPFLSVPAAPWGRQGPAGRLTALLAVPGSVLASRRALQALSASCVVGLGGFVSMGPVLAARSLRLPVVLHEANATLGLANRRLLSLAHKLLVAFDEAIPARAAARAIHCGTPVRDEIVRLGREPRTRPDGDARLRVLVLGGSEGSANLDRHAPRLLAATGSRSLEVRHQSRPEAGSEVAIAYRDAGIDAEVRADLEPIVESYRWADVALSALGAVTLAELAVCGLPAVFVPSTGLAEEHQLTTARALRRRGDIEVVSEADLENDAASRRVAAGLVAPEQRRRWAAALRQLAMPDAAERAAAVCESLLAGSAPPLHRGDAIF